MGRNDTSTDGFGMGSQELEELTDNLMKILGRARYSQKYRPFLHLVFGASGWKKIVYQGEPGRLDF